MTKPKPSYSTTNLKTPICTSMLACDGINLVGKARERGYCNKCGEAMAKKVSKPKPATLRGENSALNTKTPRPLPEGWNKDDE